MKNAKAIKGQKALAMAVVAMFALCAFTVCIGSESDAGVYGGVEETTGTDKTKQTFDVKISTGQTFTYDNIKTNLDDVDGDVTFSTVGSQAGTGIATPTTGYPSFVDSDSTGGGKKLTIKFDTKGTYTYTINAEWRHSTATDLKQTASQTFVFTVSEQINLPTSFSGYGIMGQTQEAMKITYSGPETVPESWITTSAYGENTYQKDYFTYAVADGKLTITPTDSVKNGSKGTYGMIVTITNPDTKDSDFVNVTYQVFETVTVTNDGPKYTYEGDDNAPTNITFTTNWDTNRIDDVQDVAYKLTYTPVDSIKNDVVSAGSNSNVATITGIKDAEPNTIVAKDKTKAVYTIKFTATGTVKETSSDDGTQASSKVTTDEVSTTLTIYKALQFATKPAIDDSNITLVTKTNTSINLSSYISGAYKVVFDWGDGTQTSSMDNMGKTATTYGAYHTYAKAGNYTITVYATNDQGTTTAQVFHSTTGIDVPADDTTDDTDKTVTEKEKSFIDKHGVQFIVFGILCILALVAFFYFGYQSPYVIIAAIILAALAVLCFVYHDISGIIDAFRK